MKCRKIFKLICKAVKLVLLTVFLVSWSAGMLIGDIAGMAAVVLGIPFVVIMTVFGGGNNTPHVTDP